MYNTNGGNLQAVAEDESSVIGIKRCRGSPSTPDVSDLLPKQTVSSLFQSESDNSNLSVLSITSAKIEEIDSLPTAKKQISLLLKDRKRLRKSLNSYYEQDESLLCRSVISSNGSGSIGSNTRDSISVIDKAKEKNSESIPVTLSVAASFEVELDIDFAAIVQSWFSKLDRVIPTNTKLAGKKIRWEPKKDGEKEDITTEKLLSIAKAQLELAIKDVKQANLDTSKNQITLGVSIGKMKLCDNLNLLMLWMAKSGTSGNPNLGCTCKVLRPKEDTTQDNVLAKDIQELADLAWQQIEDQQEHPLCV